MKIKNYYLVFCMLIVSGLFSCDKIDPPYTEDINVSPIDTSGNDTTITRKRKVLLEDYTGHTCGNCPKAAEAAEAVVSIYGDRIIVLGVHAGFFSIPVPPAPLPSGAPQGAYFMDFRTPEGNTYDSPQFFGISTVGNPNGMVNRKPFNGNRVVSYTNWSTAVQTLLADSADVGSRIIADYNAATRQVNITMRAKVFNALSNNLNLVLHVSEGNIITWQSDYRLSNANVPDYNHKHVLRSTVNTAWGDLFIASSTAIGTTVEKSYSFTLANNINENNTSVVAVIYDVNSLQVIQADEVKLIP